MKKLLSTVLVFSLSAILIGCAGNKVREGVPVEDKTAGSDSDSSGTGSASGLNNNSVSGTGTGTSGGTVTGTLESAGPDDPLGKRTIYFEYDSATLTPESRVVVEAHAAYIAANPGLSLTLEGHADERGTREYNLALGENRANSVSRLMQALGVPANALQAISYGEERPVSLGEGEEIWGLNRRVELLYGN